MQVTFRAPDELWKRIRRAAVDHDTTAQQIVAEALELWLKRKGLSA
jgi:predicted transcriptional regulator